MPELPDVEMIRKYFERHCLGREITGFELREKRVLRNSSPGHFRKLVVGKAFLEGSRHGKNLFIEIGGKGQASGFIGMHFGMDGGLSFQRGDIPVPEYSRAIFLLGEYCLAYVTRRMLGGLRVITSPGEYIKEKLLGPDALGRDFSLEYFRHALSGKKGSIKAVLMDQQVVAGIGNVYSDEILYQAGILPETAAGSLDWEKIRTLFMIITKVLRTAIKKGADAERFPPEFLLKHRHKGGQCPCGGNISISRVAGRTSYFCPSCQK